MTVTNPESHVYTAVIAVLIDPALPSRRVPPNTEHFDSEHAALTWLRDRAREITPSAVITTATVLRRAPQSRPLVPVRHIGATTAHEVALALDILVSPTSDDRTTRQSAEFSDVHDDPARAATEALDHALRDGISIDFADPAQSHRLLRVGMIDREWATIEYRQDQPPAGEHRRVASIGVAHYGRVEDMLADLAIGAPYRDTAHAGSHLPPLNVPADIAEDLAAFQARIDALTARARLFACDHPETLCAPSPQGTGIYERLTRTEPARAAVGIAALKRRSRRTTPRHHRPKARI